jgi:hypothetical protein
MPGVVSHPRAALGVAAFSKAEQAQE